MNTIEQIVTKYLESKQLAWEPTTLRSETYRLTSLTQSIDGDPMTLWQALESHAPYSRQTAWTRVTNMWQWACDKGLVKGNPYKLFREENARLFKHAYEKKKPQISYEEAKERISRIGSDAIRIRAIQIIQTGMRFNESRSVQDGFVRGKGNKRRRVYLSDDAGRVDAGVQYHTFRRALAAVGLKPHDLRKLFLSRLVENGVNEFELCEIAGWSSIATATSYIKTNENKLRRLVEQVQGVETDASEIKVS